MPRWKGKLGSVTAKIFDVPQDVIFDFPRITMIGNLQMVIENHRGVIHFAEDLLKLRLSKGELEIRGRQLTIRAIMPDEVFVEGVVSDIKYIE